MMATDLVPRSDPAKKSSFCGRWRCRALTVLLYCCRVTEIRDPNSRSMRVSAYLMALEKGISPARLGDICSELYYSLFYRGLLFSSLRF